MSGSYRRRWANSWATSASSKTGSNPVASVAGNRIIGRRMPTTTGTEVRRAPGDQGNGFESDSLRLPQDDVGKRPVLDSARPNIAVADRPTGRASRRANMVRTPMKYAPTTKRTPSTRSALGPPAFVGSGSRGGNTASRLAPGLHSTSEMGFALTGAAASFRGTAAGAAAAMATVSTDGRAAAGAKVSSRPPFARQYVTAGNTAIKQRMPTNTRYRADDEAFGIKRPASRAANPQSEPCQRK